MEKLVSEENIEAKSDIICNKFYEALDNCTEGERPINKINEKKMIRLLEDELTSEELEFYYQYHMSHRAPMNPYGEIVWVARDYGSDDLLQYLYFKLEKIDPKYVEGIFEEDDYVIYKKNNYNRIYFLEDLYEDPVKLVKLFPNITLDRFDRIFHYHITLWGDESSTYREARKLAGENAHHKEAAQLLIRGYKNQLFYYQVDKEAREKWISIFAELFFVEGILIGEKSRAYIRTKLKEFHKFHKGVMNEEEICNLLPRIISIDNDQYSWICSEEVFQNSFLSSLSENALIYLLSLSTTSSLGKYGLEILNKEIEDLTKTPTPKKFLSIIRASLKEFRDFPWNSYSRKTLRREMVYLCNAKNYGFKFFYTDPREESCEDEELCVFIFNQIKYEEYRTMTPVVGNLDMVLPAKRKIPSILQYQRDYREAHED